MAWPLVAAIVASAAGSALSGASAARAQRDAAALQRQTDLETLAFNQRQWDESRGSTGHAILPTYFGATEQELSGDAADAARSLFAGAGNIYNRATTINSEYLPTIQAGDQFVGDIFNGTIRNQRQAATDAVNAARSTRAKSRAGAIDQSLSETLAGLRASRMGRGFKGESTYDITRAQDATLGARRAAATEFADADIENAMDNRALNEADLQLRMSSLDLPFNRARSRIGMETMPLSAAADAYSAAYSPLNFFRIGTSTPPQMPFRTVESTPNSGMIAGTAISQGANALAQYFAQQQMMQQMRGMYSSYLSPGTTITGAGGTPASLPSMGGLYGMG